MGLDKKNPSLQMELERGRSYFKLLSYWSYTHHLETQNAALVVGAVSATIRNRRVVSEVVPTTTTIDAVVTRRGTYSL